MTCHSLSFVGSNDKLRKSFLAQKPKVFGISKSFRFLQISQGFSFVKRKALQHLSKHSKVCTRTCCAVSSANQKAVLFDSPAESRCRASKGKRLAPPTLNLRPFVSVHNHRVKRCLTCAGRILFFLATDSRPRIVAIRLLHQIAHLPYVY